MRKNINFYIAFAYAILLLSAAYYYCAPNATAIALLESTETNAFIQSDIVIAEHNYYTMQDIDIGVKANPKFTEYKTKAIIIKQKADDVRAVLDSLAISNTELTANEAKYAIKTIENLYNINEKIMDYKDWQDFKEKLHPVATVKDLELSQKAYLQALRNRIGIMEHLFLTYLSDRSGTCFMYKPDTYFLPIQVDNHCIKEGDFLTGWVAFSNHYAMRMVKSMRINGKLVPTIKGIATYRTKSQPIGTYPITVESSVKVRDTIINVRNTLFYTVK